MARPRIFVSSTCYDLSVIRSELRPFITSLGYEPVMSEYSDILYDPREHTHDSCVKEVPNCDMVVLIVGQRFGGTGIPAALESINLENLKSKSTKNDILDHIESLSVTQLEILKAIESATPVYAFIDDRVMHDHHVYEKNKKNKAIIEQMEFPSIDKRETAKYIFEFINFLSHRSSNNSISGFTRLEDIKVTLTSQWAQYFQKLLSENRQRSKEARRYADFSERLEDLKAVVLASISTPDLRDTARGAVQYRNLIGYLQGLNFSNAREVLLSNSSWEDILQLAGVVDIREVSREDEDGWSDSDTYLVLKDGTFFISQYSMDVLERLKHEWSNFSGLNDESRKAIVDVTLEDRSLTRFPRHRRLVRHIDKSLEEHLAEQSEKSEDSKDSL
ncbi:DUF4062 domain-containing protein [Aeromonas caviae]|uniref:DUF4062 domain-containing protein n=1 Tax=Aeromonas caviae TaxID=648 RepID=UPI0009B8F6B5|nr:DUF4062 domain-containing protein [Aeromonas caviae]